MKTSLALLATIAALALMPQAHASALIANCKMKSTVFVKTMPSMGDEHLSFGGGPKESEKELAVDVYDQYGGRWAYIQESDPEKDAVPVIGWALRSSLYKCQNIKPWKNK